MSGLLFKLCPKGSLSKFDPKRWPEHIILQHSPQTPTLKTTSLREVGNMLHDYIIINSPITL